MIIRQITNYLQGKLAENQAMDLWKQLLADDEAFEILEMYMMLRTYLLGKAPDLSIYPNYMLFGRIDKYL